MIIKEQKATAEYGDEVEVGGWVGGGRLERRKQETTNSSYRH